MKDLALVAWLFAPIFVGLLANGLCLRFRLLRFLAVPVDGGVMLGGRPLFGASKTWRGIVAVAGGTAIAYFMRGFVWPPPLPAANLTHPGIASVFGFVLGAAAMASELPNSFVKRRLDIAPGRAAESGLRRLPLYVLDQVDFLLGSWIVAAFVVEPTISRLAWSAIFVLVVHQAVSAAGAALGMRESAR